MANTAEVINFPVPVVALQELRVADLDDGFTRIANELLEAVMHAGLSQHQLLVLMAIMRKTYGFNKKSDWVSNEQISVLTGILPHKCSAAKSALVKRGILTQTGRVIGINKTVGEWSSLPEKSTEKKPYLKKVNLPESGKKSLPESGDGNTFQITEADDGIPVTGVTVAPTTSTVAAGSSTTFTVNVAPDDADNKLFTVTSSVPSRATVAFTGNTVTVSAPSGATAGTAVITVKTVDGEFTATHTVTVTV